MMNMTLILAWRTADANAAFAFLAEAETLPGVTIQRLPGAPVAFLELGQRTPVSTMMAAAVARGLTPRPCSPIGGGDNETWPGMGEVDTAALLGRLRIARVASCECVTKTPAPDAHAVDCLYRVLSEAHAVILRQQAALIALAGN